MLNPFSLVKKARDVCYPQVCVHCHERIPDQKVWLCGRCNDNLSYMPEQQCPKCGYPTEESECGNCAENSFVFTQAKSVFLFENAARSMVHCLKYDGMSDIAAWFAYRIYKTIFYEAALGDIDYVTAIPLHKVRKRDRGFNQSELIARSLALKLDIPYSGRLLIRKNNTVSQTFLTAGERKKNLENAFAPGNIVLTGKSILLIDDVFTTGTTVNEASKTLLKAGAAQVFVLTACHGT